MICKYCGSQGNEGSNVCPACGAPMEATPVSKPVNNAPVHNTPVYNKPVNERPVSEPTHAPVHSSPKKNGFVVYLLGIICAFLISVAFFLPYITMKSDIRDSIGDANQSVEKVLGVDMNLEDLKNISLFEFAKLFFAVSQQDIVSDAQSAGYVGVALVATVFIFALLCLLFATLKKAVPVIVFSVLGFLSHLVIYFLMTAAFIGMGNDSPYVLSGVPALYFIGYIGSFVLAIIMLVTKKKRFK